MMEPAAYERARADYEARISEFASNYERQFGIAFGELPKVKIAGVADFRAYIEGLERALGGESDSASLDEQAQEQYLTAMGMYDDVNHQVLVSERVLAEGTGKDKGMLDLVLAHELVHAYQRNHGAPSTIELAKEAMGRIGGSEDPAASYRESLRGFPAMAVIEGQAEYMSINMLRERAGDSEANADAWSFARERYEGTFADARESYRGTVSMLADAEARAGQGELGMQDMFLAMMLKELQYVVGLGYIEDAVASRGATMDSLIKDGPKTLEDMLG